MLILTIKIKIISKLTETTYSDIFNSYTQWGRNEGLKIAEMPLHFNQGTTTTHTTLQVKQSLFDSTVTEISTRNEIPIQSLLKIIFRNDVSGY